MIKNILDSMNDYSNSYKLVLDTYQLTMNHISKNFVKDSPIYNEAVKKAKQAHSDALTPLMMNHSEKVTATMKKAREQLQKAVAISPTADQLNLIAMVKNGKFSDSEKGMILDSVKGNYLADKLMHDALGMEFESPVEDIQEALNSIEKTALNYTTEGGKPNTDYLTRVVLQGDWFQQVDSALDSFVETYGKGVNE